MSTLPEAKTGYGEGSLATQPEEETRANYPRTMRAAGLGGTVLLWFQIDERGKVLRTQVAESSGHEVLIEPPPTSATC
jgi:outer membrane biosynthesis protein TonB